MFADALHKNAPILFYYILFRLLPHLALSYFITNKRLGITHPPAGAAAIVFASGKYRWEHMGIFMVGVCISIINGVLINNWSDQRQYPTGWPYLKAIKAMLFPDEKKDELSRSLRRNMS